MFVRCTWVMDLFLQPKGARRMAWVLPTQRPQSAAAF
jgi:hypothetical protein